MIGLKGLGSQGGRAGENREMCLPGLQQRQRPDRAREGGSSHGSGCMHLLLSIALSIEVRTAKPRGAC